MLTRWRCRAASSGCRCPGTTRRRAWRSSATCSRYARMRRGARAISNSSGASMVSNPQRMCGGSCLTPVTWSWGSGMCTSGRLLRRPWIPGTDSSRRNTTRHAPGLRKMPWVSGARICVCTEWKVPAVTSLWAAPCRCGIDTTEPQTFATAGSGCCASSTRSVSIRSSAAELMQMREDFPYGRFALEVQHDHAAAARLPGISGRERRFDRTIQGPATGCL